MNGLLLASGLVILGLGVIWRKDDILNTFIKVGLVALGVMDIFRWMQR